MLRFRQLLATARGPAWRARRRIAGRTGGLLITGLLCFHALRHADFAALRAALAGASLCPLVAAVAIDLGLRTAARTRRTLVILRAVSPAQIGFRDLALVVLAGGAASVVLPGPSEEGVQIAILRRVGFQLRDLLSAQLIEKSQSIFSMALLGLFFLPPIGLPRAPLCVAMAALGAIGIYRARVRRGLAVGPMLEGLGLVIGSNLLCVVMIWLSFSSVGIHPGPIICLQIFTVTACAAALPLSPGQIGVVEAAFVLAATRLGLATGTSLAVALLYHATHVIPSVLGGVMAALRWRSFIARPIASTSWRSTTCPT